MGNVAKPFRMALGALSIQTKFQYSDRELAEQIAENPYLQHLSDFPAIRKMLHLMQAHWYFFANAFLLKC